MAVGLILLSAGWWSIAADGFTNDWPATTTGGRDAAQFDAAISGAGLLFDHSGACCAADSCLAAVSEGEKC